MASVQIGATFLRDIKRIFNEGTVAGQPDEQLLERFASVGDEAAFGALVARYGPMVLAVCRGVLRDKDDAEDAFQATFLVLVRRARSIHHGDALGAWLHRVAVRVAVEANKASARRRTEERKAIEGLTMDLQLDREREAWPSLLHEELDRLPGRFRQPIVLCHMQELTHAQAATQLQLSVGTLRRRLDRGRELLRARLSRRGVALAAGLSGSLLAGSSEAAVPPGWVEATIKAATSVAGGRAVAAGAGSATAVALADGVLKTMMFSRLKLVAAALAVVATASVAAGVVITRAGGGDEPLNNKASATVQARNELARAEQPPKDEKAESRTFRGRVIGPDGKPFAGAKLYVVDLHANAVGEPKLRFTTGADGRYEFSVRRTEYEAADSGEPWRSVPIIAVADGYGPDWAESANDGGRDSTLQLVTDDVPIEGRVLDLEGKPVVGAVVTVARLQAAAKNTLEPYLELVKTDPFSASNYNFEKRLGDGIRIPGQPATFSTDADGRFRIRGIGRDRVVDLAIAGPNIQSATLTVMSRGSDAVASEPSKEPAIRILGARFEHLLPPGRSITGVVRDKETGKPLAHMAVQGEGTNSHMVTGPDGRFTVTGFPKGRRYDLMAIPTDGEPYFVTCINVPDSAGLGPIESNIECVRGIPYRLKLTDKQTGKPIPQANVIYEPVYPNPRTREVPGYGPVNGIGPYNTAKQQPDGTYVSAVLPGPGALFVRVRDKTNYMPACVDPKAFFKEAPDAAIEGMLFGDRTNVYVTVGADGVTATPQDQFTAIVLVNPPADSKPLDLEFAVERDPKLRATVVGPAGESVAGVQGEGADATVDSSVFIISRLNPMRPRRVTFTQPEKHLVGFLMARGDEIERPTVRLRPWGTVTGRLISADGKPRPNVRFQTKDWQARLFDPAYGMLPGGAGKTDAEGRFRVDGFVPGQKYSAIVIGVNPDGEFGSVFENLVLKTGETRDLGDVRAVRSDEEGAR